MWFSSNIVTECNRQYNGLRGKFIFEAMFGIAKSVRHTVPRFRGFEVF